MMTEASKSDPHSAAEPGRADAPEAMLPACSCAQVDTNTNAEVETSAAPERDRSGWIGWLLIGMIRVYQYTLARLIPPGTCRYAPTCSHYMVEALQTHGLIKGGLLGTWRICRCHPFAKGGYDPVPPTTDERNGAM